MKFDQNPSKRCAAAGSDPAGGDFASGSGLWRLAPAKINLYLKVLGRRPDGYHELDSVMARLELADRVRLTLEDRPGPDRLAATAALTGGLPPDFGGPDNLALKAARIYRRRTGWPEVGVFIELEKNIPLGAGLGGGSADGAAVLLALNRAAPAPLPASELAGLGLALGADVPFCLYPEPLARAGGVGERLGPPPESFRRWAGERLTLVNPGFQLSTARVFKNFGLTNPPPDNTLGPKFECARGEARPGENDLFEPAALLAPELMKVAESVRNMRPAFWGLSGSGPTFWLCRPEVPAAVLARDHPDWWVRETAVAAARDEI